MVTKNQRAAQLQVFQLAGAGVSQGDSTMTLVSFNSIAGIALTMAAFGTSGYITVEPGSGQYEEQINFTGITNNMDGTVTLTGISNVSMLVDSVTEEVVLTPNFAQDHAGGVNCCVSNTSGWYGTFANINNTMTIHETWTFNAFAEGANPQIDSNSYVFQPLDYITLGGVQSVIINGSLNYFVDSGSANTIVITPSPALSTYTAGNNFFIKVAATNTGATTINVNGLGAKNLYKEVAVNLSAGDILAGEIILVSYDGTNFQIIGGAGSGTGGGASLTQTFNYTDFTTDGSGNMVASFTNSLPVNAVPVGVSYVINNAFSSGVTVQVNDTDAHAIASSGFIGANVSADATATLIGQTSSNPQVFDFISTPHPVVFIPSESSLSQGNVTVTIVYGLPEVVSLPVDPTSQAFLFDDFIGGSIQTSGTQVSTIGELGWLNAGTSTAVALAANDYNHPGVISLTAGGVLLLGNAGSCFNTTLNQIPNLTIQALVQAHNQSSGSEQFFGISPTGTGNTTSGSVKIGFIFVQSTGVLSGYTSNGTTQNIVAGPSYSTATWYTLKIVTDATGANVEFFVNGSSIGTITNVSTTPTTSNFSPGFSSAIGSSDMYIDYFLMNQVLTR